MHESQLVELKAEGVVPPCSLVEWTTASDKRFPYCKIEHEFVVFESFFHCGFNIPPSKFVLNVLDWYQIELHHLNPNSVTMLSTFVHLCEAFLGIEPSLNLF